MEFFDDEKNKMELDKIYDRMPRLFGQNQITSLKNIYRRVYDYSKSTNWENIKIGDLVFIG